MQKLNPKAVWVFFVGNVIGFFIMGIALAFMGGFFLLSALFKFNMIIGLLAFIAFPFVVIILSYIWAKLQYNNFGYELTQDSILIEKGVIWKKKSSIPFVKIQNVDIIRGPIVRILGLSDLQIQTAGYSGYQGRHGRSMEGRLPGLNIPDAEKLREHLINKAKGSRV